ncbi:DUF805 domain-containing protein [Enterococcus sp. 669A]|uniref:DUF805 domain-containing protein n=1 Tax=Candidatus Enterococcus moelleringii TaxID=2815325 RepID=A0ABS3LAJ3_9ENTE|nr:DUF805 domain-containing protein [Enterococcus sp. 669A]MBO1306632.1 DUF805 domain-containing protein [Enterococcus sp. 669A]
MKIINQVPGEVGFVQAIKDFFLGYVEFKGRTTRAGYWWVQLILLTIRSVFSLILFTSMFSAFLNAGLMYDYYMSEEDMLWEVLFSLLRLMPIIVMYLIFSLAMLLPNLALTTRRMRDAGLRGRGLLVHYGVLFVLLSLQFTFDVASMWSPGYYVASMLCLLFNLIISIELFVFTLMPSNELTTKSTNSFLRFFFREKEQPVTTFKAETKVETVVESEIIADAEVKTETETAVNAETEDETVVDVETQTDVVVDAEMEDKTEAVVETETNTHTETQTESVTEIETATETEAATDVDSESETETNEPLQ